MDLATARDLLKVQCAAASQPALTDDELRAILLATARWTVWQPGATYAPGAVVVPTVQNGHTYAAIVNQQYGAIGAPGLSGTVEPIWPLYGNPDSRTGATRPYWDGYGGGGRNYAVAMVADHTVIWIEAGPASADPWDLRLATYRAWLAKAGKASEFYEYTTGNQKSRTQQVHDHCVAMARQYAPTGIA